MGNKSVCVCVFLNDLMILKSVYDYWQVLKIVDAVNIIAVKEGLMLSSLTDFNLFGTRRGVAF